MTSDEVLLMDLESARVALLERRRAAEREGVSRVRLHALDCEVADITATIQVLCARVGLDLPAGVPPMRPAGAGGLVISERILDRYVTLLRTHRTLRAAALRAGDGERALEVSRAIRSDEATIRKHCERSKLPLPPELNG